MFNILKTLKKLPVDFNQYEMREKTKGKLIALDLVKNGEGKTALDLGCRDGYWSKKLEELGYKVTAADIKSDYPGWQFVDADKKLPFADDYFDLIWSSEVLEHLDNPKFSVSEMKRVLKSGGKIILTTPNSSVWLFRIFNFFGIPAQKLQQGGHKHFFSIGDIKTIFPESKIFGFFPYFILKFRISNLKLIDFLSPVFVIREEK